MSTAQPINATLSIATLDTHTYDGTVVCQATVDAAYTAGIVIQGVDRYEGRIQEVPTVTERMPSLFYGVIEIDTITLNLDNLDGKLSRLRGEEIRGRPVRLRLYDQLSHELIDVTHMLIEAAPVGETIPVDLVAHDLDVFTTVLPRNLLGYTAQTDVNGVAIPDAQPNQITSQFPRAVDIGTAINIVFGRTMVRCGLCDDNSDGGDTDQPFADYMVGEGSIMVEGVYKNSSALQNGTIQAVSVVRQVSDVTTETLPDADQAYRTHITFADWQDSQTDPEDRSEPQSDSFYSDSTFWLQVLTGPSAGQYFRVVDGTKPPGDEEDQSSVVTVTKSDPAVGPEQSITVVPGDLIRLQVWAPLVNTVYKGRTAIRFGTSVRDFNGGDLYLVTAAVARYRPVRKNYLRDTDGFDPNEPGLFEDTVLDANRKAIGYFGGPDTSRHWVHTNTGVKAVYVDTSVLGPDDASPTTHVLFDGSGGVVQQTAPVVTGGGAWTFSIWVRTGDQISIELFSDGGGNSHRSTYGADGTKATTWRRLAVTKSTGWGSGANITVQIRSSGLGWLWGAQLERSTEPTWYEACAHGDPAGRHWSIPDALQELLHDPVWGLNQVVAASSFEDANRDLFVGLTDHDWLFLRCQGSIPDLTGSTVQAKELLDELLQLRGMRLRKEGSAWVLAVDCPRDTSQAVFGTIETPYSNAFASDAAQSTTRISLSDTVNRLQAAYSQELGAVTKGGDVQPYYPFVQTFPYEKPGDPPPPGPGQTKLYSLRFVRDNNTASRFLQYMAGALQLLGLAAHFTKRGAVAKHATQQTTQVDVGYEGRMLQVGRLVTFLSPSTQPENLLKYSQDLSQAAWVKSGVVATPRSARDPENQNWTATGLVFSGGGTISQASTAAATDPLTGAGAHAFGYVWLVRGDAGNVTVSVFCGSETHSTTVPIGMGYQRVRIEAQFLAGATGNIGLRIGPSTATTIYAWGAQLVLDYDKAYAPTTDEALPPTTRYRLQEFSRTDVDNNALVLTPYDIEDLFTYERPPAFPSRRIVPIPVDPRTVLPAIVPLTSVRVPDPTDSATGIASMGTDTRNGVTDLWVEISFQMPLANPDDLTTNPTKVVVQVSRANEDQWRDVATVFVRDTGLGTPVSRKIHGLMSETKYDIRIVSVNAYGLDNIPWWTMSFTTF